MSKLISLNELHSRFTEGKINRREFEEMLLKTILRNLKLYNGYRWKLDECVDYLSWLYPRICNAIDCYQESGASFETYVSALIRWSAREYRSRLANGNATENALWVASAGDSYVHGAEPEYLQPGKLKKIKLKPEIEPVRNPRQLLMLLLKCYYHVSDDFLRRLAPRLGMEERVLTELINGIRELRIRRDEEIRMMRERIHSQFFRCIVYERRLKSVSEHSEFYSQMKERLEKARQRLALMRKRLKQIRLDATNLQIAKILGVSKGTVDANLHALRSQIKKDAKENKHF